MWKSCFERCSAFQQTNVQMSLNEKKKRKKALSAILFCPSSEHSALPAWQGAKSNGASAEWKQCGVGLGMATLTRVPPWGLGHLQLAPSNLGRGGGRYFELVI